MRKTINIITILTVVVCSGYKHFDWDVRKARNIRKAKRLD